MGLFGQVLRLKLERVLARLPNLEPALACQQLAKVIVTRLISVSPFFVHRPANVFFGGLGLCELRAVRSNLETVRTPSAGAQPVAGARTVEARFAPAAAHEGSKFTNPSVSRR
jgi:hypothetical protein